MNDIAEALRDDPVRNASLAGGAGGLAILYSYLARARSGYGDQDRAAGYLDQAIDMIPDTAVSPDLFGGFTGVAWACEHLQIDISNTVVDRALQKYLRGRKRWENDYDLVSGLVGIGVYALERLPQRSAAVCLKLVVQRLEETAEETSDGIAWYTHPDLLPDWQREKCPNGYYNLGLAHGIPGVIGILGASYAAGVQRKPAKRLLEGAVEWMFRQKLPKGSTSTFPVWTGPGIKPEPSRAAWCYGDLGVSAALFLASRCVGNKKWEQMALEIACRTAERSLKEARVKDAGLCHGAAGLAHIFNRMFQATGNTTLRKAARFWFRHTLQLRRPGQGIGGFFTYTPKEDGTSSFRNDPDLVSGSSGIALALLAAISPVSPDWDRILLLSVKDHTKN